MNPQTLTLEMQYPGARRTKRLINRKTELNQIRQALLEKILATQVFYITGGGGVGKTRLLEEVLTCIQRGEWAGDYICPKYIVDFYHFETHSIEGLCEAVRHALPQRETAFPSYLQELERLEEVKRDYFQPFDVLETQRNEMAEAFLADLNALIEGHRALLAFDTTEVLQYEPDRVQRLLGLEGAGLEVTNWLIHNLKRIKNAVVLLAGRPHPTEQLRRDLRRELGDQLTEIKLQNFMEKDTLDYIAELAKGDDPGAKRIAAIPEDTRRVIHLYTNGQPILLALTLDYVAETERLLDDFRTPYSEAASKSKEELREIRSRVQGELVRLHQKYGRRADEAIQALGWARKGMNGALLTRVLNEAVGEEISDDQVDELLEEIKRLSFVKVRPEDKRIFLHDEMYDLLQKYVLEPRVTEAKAVYDVIIDEYEQKIAAKQKELADWQEKWRTAVTGPLRTLKREPEVPPERLAEISHTLAQAERDMQRLVVERLHYLLRRDPWEGWQEFVEQAEGAYSGADVSFDVLLRAELYDFLKRITVNGDLRGEVDRDSAIRLVRINRYVGYKPGELEQIISLADRLRQVEDPVLDSRQHPLYGAALDCWQGLALVYQGEYLEQAQTLLSRAVTTLEQLTGDEKRFEWRRKNVLAHSHNSLGYLYNQRGQFHAAIQCFQKALPLWREIGFGAELANTLNNLARTYAEVGQMEQARRAISDAIELRARLARLYDLALSYNTRGYVYIKDGQPLVARADCERALSIFRNLGRPRGIGLACILLAEATRMSADLDIYTPTEKLDLLKDAEKLADEAVDIFTKSAPEAIRRVEALIELGCIYRNWARLLHETRDGREEELQEVAEKSRRNLERAAELAGQILNRRVDALVNLGWLEYYIGNLDGAEKAFNRAVAGLLDTYRLDVEPPPEVDFPSIWYQLGKAYLLRGQIALARENDQAAIEAFTLGLEFNVRFAEHYPGHAGAQDTMYRQLKGWKHDRLVRALDYVAEIVKKHGLKREPRIYRFFKDSFGIEPKKGAS